MPNEDNNNKNKEQNTDNVNPDQQYEMKKKNAEEAINNNDAISSEQIKRDENPFSLKHFLKKDHHTSGGGSVDSNYYNSSINSSQTPLAPSAAAALSSSSSATTISSLSFPSPSAGGPLKVTGTRPKIPLNNSNNGADVDGKMKRSPRFFKYFDSSALSDVQGYRPNTNDGTGENLAASTSNILYEPYHSSFNNSELSTTVPTKNREETPQHKLLFQRSHSTYNLPNQKYSQIAGDVSQRRRAKQQQLQQHDINNSNFNKNVSSEISMVLPDFVQDHITLEMFYSRSGVGGIGANSSSNISPLSFEYDQLPDFAINENESNSRLLPDTAPDVNPMAFDLMCNSPDQVRNIGQQSIPLDLPTIPSSSGDGGGGVGIVGDISLVSESSRNNHNNQLRSTMTTNDIPLDLTARNNGFGNVIDHLGHLTNAETFQTLPDFLSDGHIHSSGRQTDGTLENFDDSASEAIIQRLRSENMRLRQELDNNSRINGDQNRRIGDLEATIDRMRNIESAYSDNLVHNMEKVEENIKRSNKKAAAAQSNVTDLRKKIKQLTGQIEILRQENEFLKEGGGAVGGENIRTHPFDRNHQQVREISGDLMAAAANAESHLRQLLNGVENLRLLATQIESINSVVVSSDDFSDCEDEDLTGPAL